MKRIVVIAALFSLTIGAHAVVAKKYQRTARTYVYESNGTVHVRGSNDVYLVSATEGGQVHDVQMVFGYSAKAEFQVSPKAQMAYDVFRVVPMGTFEAGKFKPCRPGPNQPSCTPGRYPPSLPPRFHRISNFFGM